MPVPGKMQTLAAERRKESGCRLSPAESRGKTRRPLQRMSNMTTLQVILREVIAELDQRGFIIRIRNLYCLRCLFNALRSSIGLMPLPS